MRDRLGDAPEHQADAHADAEHHADPGDGGELRLVIVVPELDVAEAAHREKERESEEDRGRDDEGPAEAVDDEAEHGARDGGEAVGPKRAPEHETARDGYSGPEDRRVKAGWPFQSVHEGSPL